MNLYNLLFGLETYPQSLMLSLGLAPNEDILDAFLKDGTIVLHTKNNDRLVKEVMQSENFVGETACPFSSEFCFLTFSFPEAYRRDLETLEHATAGPVDLWEAILFDFSERVKEEEGREAA